MRGGTTVTPRGAGRLLAESEQDNLYTPSYYLSESQLADLDHPGRRSRRKTKALWRAYRARRHALGLPRHAGHRWPRRAR